MSKQPLKIYDRVRDQLNNYLRIFSSSDKALCHIRDHILTSPESEAWEIILDDASWRMHDVSLSHVELVGGADCKARQAKSDEIFADPAGRGQHIYDAYGRLIREAVNEALRRVWYAREGEFAFYLGSTGILVCVRGDTIVSAYAPVCLGDDIANHRTSELLREGLATKDRDMKRGFDPERVGERLYQDVFWFAWRRVRARRKSRYGSRDDEKANAQDKMARALMKQKMPDYETWLARRAKVLSPL